MISKKSAWLLAVSIFSATLLHAQLLYNNGADVAVTGGGILFVDGAVENASGLFSNAGQTTVVGYFRNGSLATGGNASGEYIVYGDWENNNVFTADQSTVRLTGNTQYITGSQVTTFHNLSLETIGAVKRQTLDANVNRLLHLHDCELATSDYRMTVQNPSSGAIARHNGFVSSTGPGRLVRATYSTDVYLFPTGWNDNGNVLYRPLEITPSVTDVQSFEVRMGFGDATNEGYDISQKASNINSVNKKFFHLAKQVGSTTPSDLSIYYSISADSIWSSIGRWQVVPQWQDLEHTAFTAGFPLSHRTKKGWMDNGNQPHILINTGDAVVPFAFPNVFDPGSNDPNNATFHIINQLSLADLIDLKIFNRWGEPVFDSERDGKKEWDGKYLGKLQLMGNYVYMANVKILDTNEVKAVSGNLSLLW